MRDGQTQPAADNVRPAITRQLLAISRHQSHVITRVIVVMMVALAVQYMINGIAVVRPLAKN